MPRLLRGQGPRVRQDASHRGQAGADRAVEDVLRTTAIETSDEAYEYIVVGSGAGGGPLAANLAARGFRVLLIEAGSEPDSKNYPVPCFHAITSEEKDMAWNFFVHHYDTNEQRDREKYVPGKGILYPRAATLGGCTAHNAMMTVVPHDQDWQDIAELTGDESWLPANMWKYFQRVEKCLYRTAPEGGHGYEGWLSTSTVDPSVAAGDDNVTKTIFAVARAVVSRCIDLSRVFRDIKQVLRWDPNDQSIRAAREGATITVPLATVKGKRNGSREHIHDIKAKFGDLLTIRMNTLGIRVILDGDKRAVGLECWEGDHLYRVDPNATNEPLIEKKVYRCTREVILAGGAFNTPQLLLLSGIGPKADLEDPEIGIECLVDRSGVGRNLQDRYEVGVVSEMKQPFKMLEHATFRAPDDGFPGDPCYVDWRNGKGLYTSNGAMAAVILKSASGKLDPHAPPDLFMFALPGDFRGYYPGYSDKIVSRKDTLTWAILKAHTANTGGTVRLRSRNPREAPEIRFHYFEEGTDTKGLDLEGVIDAVKFVRGMNQKNHAVKHELLPGPTVKDEDLGNWIRDNAWGHHASCSCRMGKPDDPKAVVDSRFRVIGTKGLRIVDASVFPRIPGFFIVTPIYMISEKAADVIVEDARQT
jgi:choline dehydrogenase